MATPIPEWATHSKLREADSSGDVRSWAGRVPDECPAANLSFGQVMQLAYVRRASNRCM
jgi:hypothetical protein